MKIAIHQPEHFPYMGFFQKMKESDIFVILDNVKFRKNYFHNRNKFKSKNGEEHWFGVSVPKKSSSMMIKDVIPVNDKINNWRKKVILKLKHNFKYDFSEIYNQERLIDINMASINWARNKLNIKNEIIKASEINVTGKSSELLSNICKELNCTTYLSGPFGKNYLEEKYFNDINIEYFEPNVENYYSCVYNILK